MNAARPTVLLPIAGAAVAVAVFLWTSGRQVRSHGVPADGQDSSARSTEATPDLSRARPEPELRTSAIPAVADAPSDAPRPPSPIRLSGTLKDRNGVLLRYPNAGVLLTDSKGENRRSDADHGFYSFDDLPAGDYFLGATLWGFRDVRRTIRIQTGDGERREDLVFEPEWMLLVKLQTPDGEDVRDLLQKQHVAPLLELVAVATVEPPGDRLPASFDLDRSGFGVGSSKLWWGSQEQRDDRLQISADPPVNVSIAMRDVVLATQRVDTRIEELTFTIDLDRLRSQLSGLTFRVVDGESGAPATEASVSLQTAQSTESAVRPDAEGRVRYEGRVPGLYEVAVLMKDRVYQLVTAELQPGRVTDLGDIRLTRGVAIRGRCVDTDGRPHRVVPGLTRIEDRTDAPREPATRFVAETDGDPGSFSFKNLTAGRYLATLVAPGPPFATDAEPGWAIVPTIIDTREGPVEGIVLVVQHPSALVLRPDSDAVDGMKFEIRTTDGVSCESGSFAAGRTERVALAPGPYSLRLLRSDKVMREIPFNLGADVLTIAVQP